MKFPSKSCISLALAVLLAALGIPFSVPASAAGAETVVGVLADPHLYPEGMIGDGYAALSQGKANEAKPDLHSEGVLRSALASLEAQAKENGMQYLLITGDLTRDGEYLAHVKLAEYLLDFEKRSGVQVAVIPGNHDINNSGAKDYSSGASQKARACTPAEFRKIYARLGYDLADARYAPPSGQQGGGLSYAADLGGFRLLALDTCKYSPDTVGHGGTLSGGMISEGQMAWVLRELAAAKKAGKPVIGMGHHNLTEHIGFEGGLGSDFMLDDYRDARETLADAGMRFYLSGHMHIEEIGHALSDRGEVLYDIAGSSLVTYPYTFRVIRFAKEGGRVTADVRTLPADEALPVTAAGVTYPRPYARTGFAASFWGEGGDLAAFAAGFINRTLQRQLSRIRLAGGIDAFLKETGTDIGESLRGALGSGLAIGEWNIFSYKNLLGLVEDLLAQVDALYINDPARLTALLESVLAQLFRLRVSRLPCTQFMDSLGFGHRHGPGTLEDFGNSALAYIYGHPVDYTRDAFFMDVIRRVQSGALLRQVLGAAVEILLADVIGSELLPALRFNAKSVFANRLSKETIGCLLNVVLGAARGTVSRGSVAGLLRSLGWKGLAAAASPVVGLGLPCDIKNGLQSSLELLIHEMLLVREPDGNRDSLLVYDGPVELGPAADRDYRVPFDISVARGGDKRSAVVTWYTKRSVTASDVLVSPAIEDLQITAATEDATRTVNALDLGVATVAGEKLKATRHTATVEGLDPCKRYTFRVGDAGRGWLSGPVGG